MWILIMLPLYVYVAYLIYDGIKCGIPKSSGKSKKKEPQIIEPTFVLSEYYGRIEKAALEIVKGKEQVDTAIILWWGFDGLRIDGGGFEWIRREEEGNTAMKQSVQDAALISALKCQSLKYTIYRPYPPYFYSGCYQQSYHLPYCQGYNNLMMFNRW